VLLDLAKAALGAALVAALWGSVDLAWRRLVGGARPGSAQARGCARRDDCGSACRDDAPGRR
jgi:hypothetical protein